MLVSTMAKLQDNVGLLQRQYQALEVQLKAGAKITPKVQEVINQMIDMITNEIEPAIEDAHTTDQQNLHDKMALIVDWNKDYTTKKALLMDEFNSIQSNIEDHNILAATWEKAANSYAASVTTYEKDVKLKTDTCCDKQQAAVGAREYTPAYASCDYTSTGAGDCAATASKAVQTAVQQDFAHGLARYNDLVSGCSTRTDTVASSLGDMNGKNTHCDDSQAACVVAQKAIAAKKKQFEKSWSETVADYTKGVGDLEASFSSTEAQVRSDEGDRVNEWSATQEIKCLLDAFSGAGTFDEAGMNACKGEISQINLKVDYPVIPARVVWPKLTYTLMTDTEPFAQTCQIEEAADEAADTKCVLTATPAVSVCDKSTANNGPVWSLSAAGASFVN